MAKATVKTKTETVMKPVEVEKRTVTLELTEDEARAVYTLVNKVNARGDAYKHTHSIFRELSGLDFDRFPVHVVETYAASEKTFLSLTLGEIVP